MYPDQREFLSEMPRLEARQWGVVVKSLASGARNAKIGSTIENQIQFIIQTG